MRLFISVDIPKDVKKEFVLLQEKLLSSDVKLSLVKDFHLTLKFLGEVPKTEIEIIKKNLKEISFEPFSVHTGRIGVFPSEKSVRVIWVGIEPEEPMGLLQKKVDQSLSGMFPEEKDFRSHLTLARVKSIGDSEAYIKMLSGLPVPKKNFSVESFSLMKSTLTPSGPIHETLGSF